MSFCRHSWSLVGAEHWLQAELSWLKCGLSSYRKHALPSPPLKWSWLEYTSNRIISFCLGFSLVSSSVLDLVSVTQCYSFFLWGDRGSTWLRVLREARQKARAITYRMAAGGSSGVVPCALLFRDAFQAGTLSAVIFLTPEVVQTWQICVLQEDKIKLLNYLSCFIRNITSNRKESVTKLIALSEGDFRDTMMCWFCLRCGIAHMLTAWLL